MRCRVQCAAFRTRALRASRAVFVALRCAPCCQRRCPSLQSQSPPVSAARCRFRSTHARRASIGTDKNVARTRMQAKGRPRRAPPPAISNPACTGRQGNKGRGKVMCPSPPQEQRHSSPTPTADMGLLLPPMGRPETQAEGNHGEGQCQRSPPSHQQNSQPGVEPVPPGQQVRKCLTSNKGRHRAGRTRWSG